MVRGKGARPEVGLVAIGIAIVLLQVVPPALSAVAGIPITPPAQSTPAPSRPPNTVTDVPLVWRDFRPGEWEAGPSTTSVRVCGAALQRGAERSVLIVRFCNSQPITAQRRFAFGYDDLRIRAVLPGGTILAYDLLDYDPTPTGGIRFHESPLPDNTATIIGVGVRNVTDIVFILAGEVPFGLPIIEFTARYAGVELSERHTFEPLGPDLVRAERERLPLAPDWASEPY